MSLRLRTAATLALVLALGACSETGTDIPVSPEETVSRETPPQAPAPSPAPAPQGPGIVGYSLRWEGQTNIDGAVLRIRGGPVDSVTSGRVRTAIVRVSPTETVLTLIGRIEDDDDDDDDDEDSVDAVVNAASIWVPRRATSAGDVHTVTLEQVSGRGRDGSDRSRYRVSLERIVR